MSRSSNPLTDLSKYTNGGTDSLSGLMLKIRAQQKDNPLGAGATYTAQKAPIPQASAAPVETPAQAQQRMDIIRMFTPVEEGGALITNKTPSQLVGGAIPQGYGWMDVPQAVRSQFNIPKGTSYIGFHPGRMTPAQHQAMATLSAQRDAERNQEAQQEAALSPPTPAQ